MGINVNSLRFLLHAQRTGVDFAKTAMIGRQKLHLSFDQFRHILTEEFHHAVDRQTLAALYHEQYGDALLRYLGARVVHSYDYSAYEGATHVHDFNVPVPEDSFAQYTALIEGGTLEHVFHFPTAIKNCMQMIQVGGHYLGMSPTNNYMGHGFYQFSPELYFRVLSPENGFRIEHMLLHEGKKTKKWFTVPDPEEVKCRVGMRNATPTLLLIRATRLAERPIFSSPPMQSDYAALYKEREPEGQVRGTEERLSLWKRLLPRLVRKRIESVLGSCQVSRLFRPFVCNSRLELKKR